MQRRISDRALVFFPEVRKKQREFALRPDKLQLGRVDEWPVLSASPSLRRDRESCLQWDANSPGKLPLRPNERILTDDRALIVDEFRHVFEQFVHFDDVRLERRKLCLTIVETRRH